MIYLSYGELLDVAERVLGAPPIVRDPGLLEAALARPRATVFGVDAYPSLVEKSAAFAHSVALNHALVDGNKRLALAGLVVFLGVNGRRLTLTNDEAYELIVGIVDGSLDDVAQIAGVIGAANEPRHR